MIEVIDSTRLRDSIQCLRMYYWTHERHYIPKAPQLPRAYGSSIHACLAKHYEGETAGVCLAAFDKTWDNEVVVLQGEMDEEDPKRNPVRWAEVFMTYRAHYREEPFQIIGKPETPFFLPLTDKIALGGVLDLSVKYLNQLMIVDHKSTSYMNQRWFNSFNPNLQFNNYLLAGNEIIRPDRPITTLLVNAILVHPTEMKPERLFQRIPTTRSPEQVKFGREEIIKWWEIVQECRRRRSWPRNDSRCGDYNGCPYHPLCTDIQTDYRKLVPSKAVYREHIWDPIQNLRKRGISI